MAPLQQADPASSSEGQFRISTISVDELPVELRVADIRHQLDGSSRASSTANATRW